VVAAELGVRDLGRLGPQVGNGGGHVVHLDADVAEALAPRRLGKLAGESSMKLRPAEEEVDAEALAPCR